MSTGGGIRTGSHGPNEGSGAYLLYVTLLPLIRTRLETPWPRSVSTHGQPRPALAEEWDRTVNVLPAPTPATPRAQVPVRTMNRKWWLKGSLVQILPATPPRSPHASAASPPSCVLTMKPSEWDSLTSETWTPGTPPASRNARPTMTALHST